MSAVTEKRACKDVTINGLVLELRYEAQNLMELSRLTGLDPMNFLRRIQKDTSDPREAGMRASDLNILVPLIAAGVCHHEAYEGLNDRDMKRRICGLIDGEVAKSRTSLLMVTARLVAEILPVYMESLRGPEDDEKKADEEPKGPLP